ncbi:Asp-tRNA(Asn)/Glu-tRNA(Gln) amidotransferase subunit GatA [Candidatus Methylacidithermus pantelleriae]|uniref:Glutamyl-tRNA(Gln) amidotransferase subunit A n=1 Tax=Candidatus Methylacidithermus pantelleriae TaxID=2744239 RepID=A0A8J2FSJ6_9BACT|nr:Asp-tRNA(Asn)/Glu-tRNA(Gln) amidotransferase subunit GatA [Candidatus Methylacidithermus pantelleriae]CAF0697013.1 Glutamyl-tRNA(Gln) amidotransferase subunit A [Candidatus Methylacidithermus pantelleriae]
MNLVFDSVAVLRKKLSAGEVHPKELVELLLRRIEEVDPQLGAYVYLDRERALQDAEKADVTKPLGGIPIAIKDVLNVKGEPCRCASRILTGYVAPYDATAVAKLREAGALLVGRTNMDEFAMGSSTENSAFGVTRNPWKPDRIPGGSSGGSAAAVAAHEAFASLGSDTGGSIRQPAAMCGCVGLKPTYGRVSRYGLTAFASSLDQVGPITKTVEDAALLLQVIAGEDPCDNTSAPIPVPDYLASLRQGIAGLRIGVPREYFVPGMQPEVEQRVREALGVLENLGATLEEISLPHTEYAIATYYIVATAEASANLARYDGVRYGHRSENASDVYDLYCLTRAEGFGAEVKRRIILGTYVLSSGYYDAYYLRAQKVRRLIRSDFLEAFQQCQLLATPTSPTVAFRLGERLNDPLQMYLADIFTIAVNLAGVCAISLPCGFDSEGLPIGLQLIAGPWHEATLLRAAYAYEQATDWHKRRPPL